MAELREFVLSLASIILLAIAGTYLLPAEPAAEIPPAEIVAADQRTIVPLSPPRPRLAGERR